jgi:hypothetical protein
MRIRSYLVVGLVAVACLGLARDAAAQRGSKGWLERLSGPGPFGGWELGTPPLVCFGADGSDPSWFLVRNDSTRRFCLDAEFGWFDTDDEDPRLPQYGEVKAKSFDVNFMYGFHRSVSLGASLGFIHFGGDRFESFSRFTVAPVRLAFKPLELGASRAPCDDRWRSLLRLDFKQYLIAGRLEGSDFGNPAAPLNENWDSVSYWSIGVDASAYLQKCP